jgi:hypothetical protein
MLDAAMKSWSNGYTYKKAEIEGDNEFVGYFLSK